MIAIFHIVRIITHQITSQWGLHAQWSMKVARQKRSEICAVRVAKSKKNDLFWEHFFPDQKATKHWKGCHFFQHVDAPTRAIPHPAGCLCRFMHPLQEMRSWHSKSQAEIEWDSKEWRCGLWIAVMCVAMQEATPAVASTAKPLAEGTVGPETAEVVPVQERMWMRSDTTW